MPLTDVVCRSENGDMTLNHISRLPSPPEERGGGRVRTRFGKYKDRAWTILRPRDFVRLACGPGVEELKSVLVKPLMWLMLHHCFRLMSEVMAICLLGAAG